MNVSVTPELERFVLDLVSSGRYHSASEVFREGLRLLEERERRRLLDKWLTEGLTSQEQSSLPAGMLEAARSQLQVKIQEGLDALDRGDVVDGHAFFAQWRAQFEEGVGSNNPSLSRAKRRV